MPNKIHIVAEILSALAFVELVDSQHVEGRHVFSQANGDIRVRDWSNGIRPILPKGISMDFETRQR